MKLTIASVAHGSYVGYVPGFIASASITFSAPEILLAASDKIFEMRAFQRASEFAENNGARLQVLSSEYMEYCNVFSSVFGDQRLLAASCRWLLPAWSSASGDAVFFTDIDTFFVPGTDWNLAHKRDLAVQYNGIAYSYRRHQSLRVSGGAHLVLNPEYFQKVTPIVRRVMDNSEYRASLVSASRDAARREQLPMDDEFVLGTLMGMVVEPNSLVPNSVANTETVMPGLHLGVARRWRLPKTANLDEARRALETNAEYAEAAKQFGTAELHRLIGSSRRSTLPNWGFSEEARHQLGMLAIRGKSAGKRIRRQRPELSGGSVQTSWR